MIPLSRLVLLLVVLFNSAEANHNTFCDAGFYSTGNMATSGDPNVPGCKGVVWNAGPCCKCPANYYCPGGKYAGSDTSFVGGFFKCPDMGVSPAGSAAKTDCSSYPRTFPVDAGVVPAGANKSPCRAMKQEWFSRFAAPLPLPPG